MYQGILSPINNTLFYVKTTQIYPKDEMVLIESLNGSYIAKTTEFYTHNEHLFHLENTYIDRKCDIDDLYTIDVEKATYLNDLFEQVNDYLNLQVDYLGVWISTDGHCVKFVIHSDTRLNFKEIVTEILNRAKFGMKIELLILATQQHIASKGAIATCGREACCYSIYHTPVIVTPKLLQTNNIKINENNLGVCGKYKCCYESEIENEG